MLLSHFLASAVSVVVAAAIGAAAASSSRTYSPEQIKHSTCKDYPKELKSLEDCCEIPVMFKDYLVNACKYLCSEPSKTEKPADCVVRCLLTNNKVFRYDKFNHTAMETMFDQFGLGDPSWKPVIKKALETCPLVLGKMDDLQESFEIFENCTKTVFLEKCVEFKNELECDLVDDFMTKCQNLQPNCTIWPRWIVKLPEMCCDNRPELFKSDLKAQSDDVCASHAGDEVSKLGSMQCKASTLLKLSKIKTEVGWNFTKAQEMLKDNTKNDKWKPSIEKSVETCEKHVQGQFLYRFCFECPSANMVNLFR